MEAQGISAALIHPQPALLQCERQPLWRHKMSCKISITHYKCVEPQCSHLGPHMAKGSLLPGRGTPVSLPVSKRRISMGPLGGRHARNSTRAARRATSTQNKKSRPCGAWGCIPPRSIMYFFCSANNSGYTLLYGLLRVNVICNNTHKKVT